MWACKSGNNRETIIHPSINTSSDIIVFIFVEHSLLWSWPAFGSSPSPDLISKTGSGFDRHMQHYRQTQSTTVKGWPWPSFVCDVETFGVLLKVSARKHLWDSAADNRKCLINPCSPREALGKASLQNQSVPCVGVAWVTRGWQGSLHPLAGGPLTISFIHLLSISCHKYLNRIFVFKNLLHPVHPIQVNGLFSLLSEAEVIEMISGQLANTFQLSLIEKAKQK